MLDGRRIRGCRVLFNFLAAAVLIPACGGSGSGEPPPAPPSISVSSSSIDAAAGGESVSVEVSNGGGGTLNWSASIPAGVDWARISGVSSGANSGTVRIEIDPNPGAEREFELAVMANDTASRTVAVRQADGRPVIEITAASMELNGEGGGVSLQVRNAGVAPMQWSASLPDGLDWAHIRSGEEGTDADEIVVRYDLNGGAERALEVTVTASTATNSPQSLTLGQQWFASSACTYPEARAEVFGLMKRWYYFNDEPDQRALYDRLVLEDYNSLDSLLEYLRHGPEDLFFSSWSPAPEIDRGLAGEILSFGFFGQTPVTFLDLEPIHHQVLDVYAGSPAAEANLERGDRIVGISGKRVDEMTVKQIIRELHFGEEGHEVSFEVEKQSGERRTISLARAFLDFPAVPEEPVRIWETAAGKVGYVLVRGLIGDANERLLDEFAGFNAAGVRNLIVDLRYSAGGSLPVAYGLATLIGGPELFENGTRTVLARTIHNEQLRSEGLDTTVYFGCDAYPTPGMAARCENESAMRDLENVVFITSVTTISPGELVISALDPFENVTRVGIRTLGKPVGQYGLGFCRADPNDSSTAQAYFWPVAFANVNAEGAGGYYDGIFETVGCQVVEDDVSRPLGDPREARIAAALRYLETGSCGVAAASAAAAQGVVIPPGIAIQAIRPGSGEILIEQLPRH